MIDVLESPVQIKTSTCETIYQVGEHKLRLWIITGGTPALDFEEFGYSKRYPIKDTRWMNCDYSKDGIPKTDNWLEKERRYAHQNPNKIQGPTWDVLPEGEKTIHDFLFDNLSKKTLREQRMKFFSFVKSKRYYDKDDRCYFYLRFDADCGKLCPVTVTSRYYGGRCEEKIDYPCVDKSWKALAKFINPIFDYGFSNDKWHLEDLTEEQFETLVSLYNNLNKA